MQEMTNYKREDRERNELRMWKITPGVMASADGSVLIQCGNTQVICSASIDDKVPAFLQGTNQGWITAEYGMLPRSTNTRMKRESVVGFQTGRTTEIQRMIGRSIRGVVNLPGLGPRQIILDCDVIQADGGTRTASITGAFVATVMAVHKLLKEGLIPADPIIDQVAAVSCGFINGVPYLDLDYAEDSKCDSDINIVLTRRGEIVEIQGTAERNTFSANDLMEVIGMAKSALNDIYQLQRDVLRKCGIDLM